MCPHKPQRCQPRHLPSLDTFNLGIRLYGWLTASLPVCLPTSMHVTPHSLFKQVNRSIAISLSVPLYSWVSACIYAYLYVPLSPRTSHPQPRYKSGLNDCLPASVYASLFLYLAIQTNKPTEYIASLFATDLASTSLKSPAISSALDYLSTI